MAEQGIPGLAVALVDKDQPLWVEGFGHLDGQGSAPVNADTIFSVQSMSKLFTATAVMQAVAAGRLDLDEPITTYLPGFTVHSAFEEHPERKITLRMLLSHTAGFTHEAPVGNNNELDPGDFDAHVRSISDTWLRFPVGTGYAYSNLGIDLAGYILERVEGMPFSEVMRESLLEPLGHGAQHLRPGGDPLERQSRGRTRRPLSRAAALRADDGGRRPLRERRGPRAVPPLPAERRLDRRPGRARPEVARRDADGPAAASRRAGRVRARRGPAPLEHAGRPISSSTAAAGTGSSPTCGGCPRSGSGSPS